ncbi:hypothetical protein SAMN04488522_101270 [Pedobacter caeni]|uniref:Uncharacterized protein n=2 Tax=Pedobacter caeni TaxID=288992 RepID=A0A1M4TPC6_9SPHI|nr:hypothetical protein SAMN04488522_101270 [Pedobacter caeni]
MGGKEKAIVGINAAIVEMKSRGMSFSNVSIGKTGKFYTNEKELYCVVPQGITLNKEGGYFSSLSS